MVDIVDKEILAALQADARLSYTRLASHVNLPPACCRDRLRRLEQAGYILAYTARLDPAKLGLPLLMFMEITLDRTHPQAFHRLPQVANEMPEVLECHRVTGTFDFLIKVRVRDIHAANALLARFLRRCTGVQRTHTRMVIEEVLCLPGVRLI